MVAKARAAYSERWQRFLEEQGSVDRLCRFSRFVVTSISSTEGADARIEEALKEHSQRMRQVAKIVKSRFAEGRQAIASLYEASYFGSEAEFLLERARTSHAVVIPPLR
jgi:hypothetical protein